MSRKNSDQVAKSLNALACVFALVLVVALVGPILYNPAGSSDDAQEPAPTLHDDGATLPAGSHPQAGQGQGGQADSDAIESSKANGGVPAFSSGVVFDKQDRNRASRTEEYEGVECESGSILARLVDGTTLEDAVGALNHIDGLQGIDAVKQAQSYVKFGLPDGVSVADAIELMQATAVITDVQPNIKYDSGGEEASDDAAAAREEAATASMKSFAISRTAGKVAGTDLGDALGLAPQATLPYPPNDQFFGDQWALTGTYGINIESAWQAAADAPNADPVIIAVIDGGFFTSHNDFLADTFVYPVNVTNWTTDLSGNMYHGTHVSGIIAAGTNNGYGIAGTVYNSCKLMPVKVRDANGDAYTEYLIDAFSYIVDARENDVNVRVANISMGYEAPSARDNGDYLLYALINEAYEQDVLAVASAGNDDGATPPYRVYPADFDNVVGVINVDQGGAISSSSNYNVPGQRAKGISAPGEDIYSTIDEMGTYRSESGTSMAAPFVSGVAGLMFAVDPELDCSSATSKLYSGAAQYVSVLWDDQKGYGRLNASNSVGLGEFRPYMTGPTVAYKGQTISFDCYYTALDSTRDHKRYAARVSWFTSDSSVLELKETSSGTATFEAKKAGEVTLSCVTPYGKRVYQTVVVHDTIEFANIRGATHVASGSSSRYYVQAYPATLSWTYSVSPSSAGTIDPRTGVFAAASGVTGLRRATVTATCDADSSVRRTMQVNVVSNDLGADDYKVELPAASYTYTGDPIRPEPLVTLGNSVLYRDEDYTLSWGSNVNAATYGGTVTITGKGDYAKSKTVYFPIERAPIVNADIWMSPTMFAYDGTPKTPTVTVRDIGVNAARVLQQGTDYTVDAESVVSGYGNVTVTAVAGRTNFYGSASARFYVLGGDRIYMHRLYNPNSGEHFYTSSDAERDMLRRVGWRYENLGWYAPTVGTDVYRLYNPNAGDHHYTTSAAERDMLRRVGWRYEGVGWKSVGTDGVPLYRQYNPNARSGSHNYTTSKAENDMLVRAGWRAEGIGWYGM